MLFQELNKLKWNTVMSAIVLITIGIFMVICPDEYVITMIQMLGAVLLILAVLGVLEFLSSNKALIHYVYLTGWLIIGIAGSTILVFEINALYTISWIFGVFLILIGLGNVASALSYARRAGRRGWWVLIPLSFLQIGAGLVVLLNPWWNTPEKLFKVVGVMILFSSLISALRLIRGWPLKAQ
jgi:uncharacterized membrane protein HdeD (DUF308 family)